jgi:hypothetical protein
MQKSLIAVFQRTIGPRMKAAKFIQEDVSSVRPDYNRVQETSANN